MNARLISNSWNAPRRGNERNHRRLCGENRWETIARRFVRNHGSMRAGFLVDKVVAIRRFVLGSSGCRRDSATEERDPERSVRSDGTTTIRRGCAVYAPSRRYARRVRSCSYTDPSWGCSIVCARRHSRNLSGGLERVQHLYPVLPPPGC